MIRTCALIAVLISGALIDLAHGNDLVECEPQRVTGDARHWAYRIVDGRECWYPGRPGKPKNELFWGHGTTPSARQLVDQPEAETETEPPELPSHLVAAPPEKPQITETEPPELPSHLVAAPPEKPQTTEAMPEEWRATAADQLLAFTCCWPELEEAALPPQSTPEPPAWPLVLLPLGLYALWWIARPRRGLRAVRAGDAGRVAARTRLHRHNGRNSIRERREVSAIGVGRSARRDNEQLSSRRRCSTGLDESATSQFVLPINEQQHVSLASLVDAPDPMARPSVRSRLVTE
jgi:hypothetical protein